MKKRKSPVALLTVLVLAIVGLVIAAKPFSNYTLSAEEQQKLFQAEQEAAMKARTPAPADMSKVDVSNEQEVMKAQLKAAPKASIKRVGEMETDGSPSVIMPEQVEYKPKPNDAATSSQWYDKK
jgi:hypothetical protein